MHVSLYAFSFISKCQNTYVFWGGILKDFFFDILKIYRREFISFFYKFYLIFLLNKYLLCNIKFTVGEISDHSLFHLEINMLLIFSSLKVNLRFYFTEIIERHLRFTRVLSIQTVAINCLRLINFRIDSNLTIKLYSRKRINYFAIGEKDVSWSIIF